MTKLFSRKFIVTLLTLLGFSLDSSDNPTNMITMAVVSCAYVIAQAFVDRSQIVEVQKTASQAIAKAQSLLPSVMLAFVCMYTTTACASAQRLVETAAPFVDPLLQVVGFCKEHGADVSDVVAKAKRGDAPGAALQAALVVQQLRESGVELSFSTNRDVSSTTNRDVYPNG